MMTKTFSKGGVHPQENKLSAAAAIERFEVPKQVTIPLGQHIGAPAAALVKKGDKVKVGTLIAESGGFISANIHSSVSGVVNKVGPIVDSSGYPKPCILIDVEGDEWEDNIDTSNKLVTETPLTNNEIVARIKDCGIVGLGGATFPTHVKFMIPDGQKANVLVINGVECEPYLTSDHRIMLEKADEILVALDRMITVAGVQRAVIGIEKNKPDVIANFLKKIDKFPKIEICPLKVQYPQGAEKQLLDAALGRKVPSGTLPLAVGAIVSNVGTIFAIYEAIYKNKPLIERVVTVTGKSLKTPANYMVRIGTNTNSLIEKSGGLPENTKKIINGGPMMGKSLTSHDIPVTKGTSGLLLLNEETIRKDEGACIRCAKCVSACPMNLEPYLMSKLSQKYMWEPLESESIADCCECGSCSYTCPSSIPLLDYIRVGKAEVMKNQRARK